MISLFRKNSTAAVEKAAAVFSLLALIKFGFGIEKKSPR